MQCTDDKRDIRIGYISHRERVEEKVVEGGGHFLRWCAFRWDGEVDVLSWRFFETAYLRSWNWDPELEKFGARNWRDDCESGDRV